MQDQEQELHRRLVGREVAAGPNRPAQLGIEGLDGVRGMDDPADLRREGEERDDLAPVPLPSQGDREFCLAPIAVGESFQRGDAGLGILGPVDLLERRRDGLAVLVGDEGQRIADQMDDTGLDLGFREDRRDRLGKALEAIESLHTSSDFTSFIQVRTGRGGRLG